MSHAIRRLALLLLLLIPSLSLGAAAQVVVRVSPPTRGVPFQSPALVNVQSSASALRVEAERRGLTDVAQAAAQLESIARRGLGIDGRGAPSNVQRELDIGYRDARRRLFAYGNRVDEAFLDRWDELAFHVRAVRLEGAPPGPIPGPLPPPVPAPPVVATYSFDGAFEQSAVRFQGTPEQLHAQCLQFVRAARVGNVDDVRLPGGAVAHNRSSYWAEDALCSIAVLNAQPINVAGPTVVGSAEDLPFRVTGDVRALISTYLPRALAGDRFVDDVVVDGRPYRNGGGYWTAAEVTQLVLSQINTGVVPGPLPPPPPAPPVQRWIVEGAVDGRPFRLTAPNAPEIDLSCRAFFSAQGLPIARRITLDGQTLMQRGGRPWDVTGACQFITTRARPI